MSAHVLPEALTSGYSKSFKDMLAEGAVKVLTIQELQALDDVECCQEIARSELENQIKSVDGTP